MEEELNKYGVAPDLWQALSRVEKNKHYKRLSAKTIRAASSRGRRDFLNARESLYRVANLEARRQRDWEYRLANLEARRQRDREYYRDNLQRRLELSRDSYWRNHQKQLARSRSRWSKQRSKRTIALSPEAVMNLIDKAVSKALPRFVRDDVISAMCLAMLEGELFVENVGKEAAGFLRAYNREFDQFKTISLDAPLAGYDGVTLLDKLISPQSGEE